MPLKIKPKQEKAIKLLLLSEFQQVESQTSTPNQVFGGTINYINRQVKHNRGCKEIHCLWCDTTGLLWRLDLWSLGNFCSPKVCDTLQMQQTCMWFFLLVQGELAFGSSLDQHSAGLTLWKVYTTERKIIIITKRKKKLDTSKLNTRHYPPLQWLQIKGKIHHKTLFLYIFSKYTS